MKIVVIGGTGLIGSKVVEKLKQKGHEAIAAAPNTGVNTITGKQIQTMNPGAGYETKFVLRHQPNGITLRRGQSDLHQWVNTFIYFIKNNGELDAICQKWLGVPLPELPVF